MINIIITILVLSGFYTEVQPHSIIDLDYVISEGEPFFVIGNWWGLPKGVSFEDLKNAGFNFTGVSCWDPKEIEIVHRLGMKGGVYIGRRMDQDRYPKSDIDAKMKEILGHPGLLCWYGRDESNDKDGAPISGLLKGYRYVKQKDPNHVIWQNYAGCGDQFTNRKDVWNWSSLKARHRHADVLSMHCYPVGREVTTKNLKTIAQVGELVEILKSTLIEKGIQTKPIWCILQGYEKDKGIYPDFHQTRFMAYDAIIHGATGIIYYYTHSLNKAHPLWRYITKVTEELNSIYHVLTSREGVKDISIEYDRSLDVNVLEKGDFPFRLGIWLLSKRCKDGCIYLLTENNATLPIRQVKFKLPRLKKGKVEVLFEDRTLPIKDGEFRDNFKPFEIHVYKIKEA
ncbi:MAG: hypothetical protein QME40_07155 [bacterium]|nr:hypothetical protein [bacterium]